MNGADDAGKMAAETTATAFPVAIRAGRGVAKALDSGSRQPVCFFKTALRYERRSYEEPCDDKDQYSAEHGSGRPLHPNTIPD